MRSNVGISLKHLARILLQQAPLETDNHVSVKSASKRPADKRLVRPFAKDPRVLLT